METTNFDLNYIKTGHEFVGEIFAKYTGNRVCKNEKRYNLCSIKLWGLCLVEHVKNMGLCLNMCTCLGKLMGIPYYNYKY